MIKLENRASVVLYNFLTSNRFQKPFLLPANVCPIVPSTFLKAEVDFEFVDIDESYSINQSSVLELLSTQRYSGVLFVHSYGKLYDVDLFFNSIKIIAPVSCIIDDRCLCEPCLSMSAIGISDLVLFSTGYSKYVDMSMGGWGYLNDRFRYNSSQLEYNKHDFSNLMVKFKNCLALNCQFKYTNTSWLDTSKFSMSEEQFFTKVNEKLLYVKKHKEQLNCIYSNNLPTEIQYPSEFNNWRFNIAINKREKILTAIFNADLFAGTNYPSVAYMYKGQNAINAMKEGKRIINLFNDFRFDEEKAFKICKIINSIH